MSDTRTSPRNTNNPYASRNREGKKKSTPRMKRFVRKFASTLNVFAKKKTVITLPDNDERVPASKPAAPIAVITEMDTTLNPVAENTPTKPDSPKRKAEVWDVNQSPSHMRDDCHSSKKRRTDEEENTAANEDQVGTPMKSPKQSTSLPLKSLNHSPLVSPVKTSRRGGMTSRGGMTHRGAMSGMSDEEAERIREYENELLKTAFGPNAMKFFDNEAWSERKTGMDGVLGRIESFKYEYDEEEEEEDKSKEDGTPLPPEQRMVLRAACVVLQRALEERVAPIYLYAMDIFRAALKQFGIGPGSDADGSESVDMQSVAALGLSGLTPQLLMRMNDSNARSQREACRCLLLLARQQNWRGMYLVAPYLMKEDLPVHPRLTLLRLLIPETGFRKGGALVLSPTMSVAVPALRIADDKVRKAAVGVVVATYKVSGSKRVMKHLQGIKPALMKILQRKFAEVDSGGDDDGKKSKSRRGSSNGKSRRDGSSSKRRDGSSSKSRREQVQEEDRRSSKRQQQPSGVAASPMRPHSVAMGNGAAGATGSEAVPSPYDTYRGGDAPVDQQSPAPTKTLNSSQSSVALGGGSGLNSSLNSNSGRGILDPLPQRDNVSSAPTSLLFDDGMYSSTTYDTFAQQQRGDWNDSDDDEDMLPARNSPGSRGSGAGSLNSSYRGTGQRQHQPASGAGRPGFGSKESIFNLGDDGASRNTPGAPKQRRRPQHSQDGAHMAAGDEQMMSMIMNNGGRR